MKTRFHSVFSIVLVMTILPLASVFATKHVIDVQNYSFNPSSITNVQVGDTIRWVWVSGSHTTTSTTIPSGAASWDQPINSTSTFYEYKVMLPGTYDYKCTPHAAMGMVGSFQVAAAATLSVTPANQNVAATAGTTVFSVVSNSAWTAASNMGWCTITTSGSGNGSITASFSANPTTNQRIATISVTVAGLPVQTTTVSQAGAAATLTVTPANQNVGSSSGSTSFSVISNTSWTSVSNASWCTVSSSGTGSGSITAAYTANTSVSQRVATVTVTVSGGPVQISTLTQAGVAATLSVTPANQNVGETAGNVSFSVLSNTDWTAVSDAAWCTVVTSGSGNFSLVADYAVNTARNSRVANITVTVAGLPAQVVTVTQSGSTVGIAENPEAVVTVYPNPSRGLFTILPGNFAGSDVTLSVLDQKGNEVYQKYSNGNSNWLIDLSGKPDGTYILKIESKDKRVVKRLSILR